VLRTLFGGAVGKDIKWRRALISSGALNLDDDQSGDPHDEVVHLEERIEDLAAKIESCRKLILVSRIAVAGGSLVLTGMLFSVIRFDPATMAAAVAALLGGIVIWSSNSSTAQQAAKELASAESDRSALIEEMDLGDVTPLRGFSARSQDGTTA
jgi:hypothetical protein